MCHKKEKPLQITYAWRQKLVIRADRIEGLHMNIITILLAVAAFRLRDKNT